MASDVEGALRLAGFSSGGVFALATAGELLEQVSRTVSWIGMFDTPVIVLEPEYSREAVLSNLIAEVHDQVEHRCDIDCVAGSDVVDRKQDLAQSMRALARQLLVGGSETEQVNAILD